MNRLESIHIMNWVPIVFVTFKLLVLGTGMFFAIKWHYDQEKEKRVALRKSGKVIIVFAIALMCLGLFTYVLASTLGLDLTFP
ncbi:hypothetical protein ACO0K7_10535 [Undibacterium sp. Ji67W]|uniref:hypothetical protein n=1 Tax=Undibacterium sp. Ji67W TaxID=3413042 RepID=UPI003BF2BBB6